jgi:hypothetical protein
MPNFIASMGFYAIAAAALAGGFVYDGDPGCLFGALWMGNLVARGICA